MNRLAQYLNLIMLNKQLLLLSNNYHNDLFSLSFLFLNIKILLSRTAPCHMHVMHMLEI